MTTKEKDLLATVARILGSFKLPRPTNYSAQPVGSGTSYLLQVAGRYYLLTANGGEFMLDNVNSDEYARTIPLTYYGRELNPATIALRIATDLRDEPIDWADSMSDEENEILLQS